jgi:predicted RNase H-like HicB family nuclease
MTGTGNSREAALADLEAAARFGMAHMQATGQAVPAVGKQVPSIKVAA